MYDENKTYASGDFSGLLLMIALMGTRASREGMLCARGRLLPLGDEH